MQTNTRVRVKIPWTRPSGWDEWQPDQWWIRVRISISNHAWESGQTKNIWMKIVLGGRDEVSWLTGADVLLRRARGTFLSQEPRSIFGGELSICVSTYHICSRTGSLSSLPFPCLPILTTSLTIPSWVPTNKQKLPSSISSKAWAIKKQCPWKWMGIFRASRGYCLNWVKYCLPCLL